MTDLKKYNRLEPVLQEINSKFISLPSDEVTRNDRILNAVLTTIITKMQQKDQLFNEMFRRVFYGGSYYDGLRVGKPDEYDLDLLLTIPKLAKPQLTVGNIPGFVHLQLNNFYGFMKQPEAVAYYKNFDKLFDGKKYLDTGKVLAWMEGVLQKTLNEFVKNGTFYDIDTGYGTFKVSFKKGGPALTLLLLGKDFKIDIDLVTCFVFPQDMWPKGGFISNPTKKNEFFIVPKAPPKLQENQPTSRYWRLSFQEQEMELFNDKRFLKPTVKLLKKLRDNLDHKPIASYYIKTAVMLTEKKLPGLGNHSLSYSFMTALKEYQEMIECKKIAYYWHPQYNLLGKINPSTLENISNRLKVIISKVERNLDDDPTVIAYYLLNSREYEEFKKTSSEQEPEKNDCTIV